VSARCGPCPLNYCRSLRKGPRSKPKMSEDSFCHLDRKVVSSETSLRRLWYAPCATCKMWLFYDSKLAFSRAPLVSTDLSRRASWRQRVTQSKFDNCTVRSAVRQHGELWGRLFRASAQRCFHPILASGNFVKTIIKCKSYRCNNMSCTYLAREGIFPTRGHYRRSHRR
jgi:hypothetical protein